MPWLAQSGRQARILPPFGGIDSATLFNNLALLNISLKLSFGWNIALIKAYTLCTGSDLTSIFGRQGGHRVTLIGDLTRMTRLGGHRDHLGDLTEAPLQCMSPKLKVLNKFPGRHLEVGRGAPWGVMGGGVHPQHVLIEIFWPARQWNSSSSACAVLFHSRTSGGSGGNVLRRH